MGLEREGGNNAAVEGSLNAPQVGGGRASRRAAAAEVVEKTGRLFYCVDRCKLCMCYAAQWQVVVNWRNDSYLTCRGSALVVNISELLHLYFSLTHMLGVASLQHQQCATLRCTCASCTIALLSKLPVA